GYASEPVNFPAVRDPLGWSLPPVWHLAASRGNTPMIPRRIDLYCAATQRFLWRHDLEGDSHIVTGRRHDPDAPFTGSPQQQLGAAYVRRNPTGLPRARLVGQPVYVDDQLQAAVELIRLGAQLRDRLVVEDPSHPLAADATVSGTAQIVADLPERVVV